MPLGLKCLVQPGEHGVELPGQLVELVASPSQLDSLVEVAAGADLRRRGGDLLHGTQHPARDEIPAHNGGKHQEGHEYQGHLRNVGELHLALGLGHRAPEPQPGKSRLGQGAVVDIVEYVPGGDLLDHLILKGQVLRLQGDGIFAVEEGAVLLVEGSEDAVDLVEEVVVHLQVALAVAKVVIQGGREVNVLEVGVILHLIDVVRHGLDEAVADVFENHLTADGEDHPVGDGRHQDERRRKPQRDLQPDGRAPHGALSSRRT